MIPNMRRFALFILLFTTISINIVHAQTPTALQKYISAAELAMDNEKSDEAIVYLKKAIEIAPDNFVPYYLLGSVYIFVNDSNNAVKYYNDVLNLINTNTISQKFHECFGHSEDVSYRKIMTEMYDVLAEHYKTIGQIKLAKRYNNLNIQLNIASGYKIPVVSSLERIYLCYAEENKWNECLEYFDEILMVIPTGGAWGMCEAVCHAAMGDCSAQLGNESKMISEYQQAARLGHLGAINILKNAEIVIDKSSS